MNDEELDTNKENTREIDGISESEETKEPIFKYFPLAEEETKQQVLKFFPFIERPLSEKIMLYDEKFILL